MAFEQWSMVVVPFPFADRTTTQRRPAVVVSRPEALGARCGHSVLAMVTSASHRSLPLDAPVSDLDAAGLPVPSVVRMKLFTLDDRLIERQIGSLAALDVVAVTQSLTALLS